MDGLRAGRMWVDHGTLVQSLDVRLRAGGREVPLGGVLRARPGTPLTRGRGRRLAADAVSDAAWRSGVSGPVPR